MTHSKRYAVVSFKTPNWFLVLSLHLMTAFFFSFIFGREKSHHLSSKSGSGQVSCHTVGLGVFFLFLFFLCSEHESMDIVKCEEQIFIQLL